MVCRRLALVESPFGLSRRCAIVPTTPPPFIAGGPEPGFRVAAPAARQFFISSKTRKLKSFPIWKRRGRGAPGVSPIYQKNYRPIFQHVFLTAPASAPWGSFQGFWGLSDTGQATKGRLPMHIVQCTLFV